MVIVIKVGNVLVLGLLDELVALLANGQWSCTVNVGHTRIITGGVLHPCVCVWAVIQHQPFPINAMLIAHALVQQW